MGYVCSFIVGGFLGFMIVCLISSARDQTDREELIESLKKEIYETIHSSSDYDKQE